MTPNLDNLSGVWCNQLGSTLHLCAHEEDGSIVGSLQSVVGGVPGPHPVVGYFVDVGDGLGVIGFVVRWSSSRSVTSWTGHFNLHEGTLTTSWLLTEASLEDGEWASTRVGHDVFRSQGPLGSDDIRSSASLHA